MKPVTPQLPDNTPVTADDRLRRLLHTDAWQPADNPWFTPRVLNRLPERRTALRRSRAVAVAVYVLAALLCALLWGALLAHVRSATALTVADLLGLTAVACTTLVLGVSALMRFAWNTD